jgi:signal recognition particle subunit SRP68
MDTPEVEEVVVTPVSAEKPAVDLIFTLEVLKITKESQQQHGLRHLDYQRYRTYCTRRIRRLRKTLHFVCGNMRRYQKREITMDDVNDSKFLLIPLFQSERAWAYAMQLKQEATTDARKKFRLINRLRKSVKFAKEFEKLSESVKCDARTKLEAQGYANLVNGQLHFESQKWNESLDFFNISKKIYENLSATLKGDDAQAFYLQKVEEINPNIRYCNYILGDETAKSDLMSMKLKSGTGSELAEKIDELIHQTKQEKVTTFSEIEWRNKITLQIKNDKIRSFLVSIQEYDKQIQATKSFDEKTTLYESILKESVDIIQIVRDELKLDPIFQALQRGQALKAEEKPSNTLLLFSYLTWTRINKTIDRNLLMVDLYKSALTRQQTNNLAEVGEEDAKLKNVKHQDIVRLYDIIIQNHKDLSNLVGLGTDAAYQADNELQVLYFKAFRSFYICLFYLANKKYSEAVGFCFKCENYNKQVASSLEKLSKNSELLSKKSIYVNDLRALEKELNELKYKIQTASLLKDESETTKDSKDGLKDKLEKIPLTERLDIYFEDNNLLSTTPNIIKLPLSYESIPCKPLFFDLALNHVELPSLEDKIDAKKPGQLGAQQGVKGFFKGLLGFGK